MAQHRIVISVSGRGRFPVDMFRYDHCFPASEADSGLIESTFEKYGDWTINIARYIDRKPSAKAVWQQYWTVARWQSFGVTMNVVDVHKTHFTEFHGQNDRYSPVYINGR